MRGIETFPVKLLLIVILLMIIIGVAFWQMDFFLGFNTEKNFKEDIVNAFQSIRSLQSLGDEGSISAVWINVPAGHELTLSVPGDYFYTEIGGQALNVSLTANVTKFKADGNTIYCETCDEKEYSFTPGNYEIRLYYGQLGDDKLTNKEWIMIFNNTVG